MKILKYLIFIVPISVFTTSCKKFFDVKPKTEVVKDDLFQKESGFRDALSGVYIQLKDNKAYGQALTMTTMEYLVSSWDVSGNTAGYWLGLFNYQADMAEAATDEIYRQQYATVASINEILSYIDKQKSVFGPGMYELIKGECLALRAYCHFDILRLFGPIPSQPSVGNKLPYVKQITRTQNPLLSFDTYKTELLNDLTEAENLLKDKDPFTKYSMMDFRKGVYNPENDFSSYRYLRMNYFAVKALQARAYLWFGDNAKAYEAAKFVIDAKNADGTAKFRLGNSTDMTNKDYVLTSEHIFGLYDFQLYKKYSSMFPTGNFRKGANETLVKNQLYGNTGTDIREVYLWEMVTNSSVSSYVLKKYQVSGTVSQITADNNQIPMLRISEMYLIAMESSPGTEYEQLWNTYKLSRNFTGPGLPSDLGQRKMELVKEYRKEFYAEGQAFFAYKRVNAPKASVLFAPATATVDYLLPMPKIEITITK